MAQLGAKVGVIQRIETLKGWGRQLGKEIPLCPKPVAAKPKHKRRGRR